MCQYSVRRGFFQPARHRREGWGNRPVASGELPADSETPCILLEPLHGETGEALDFRWTSMNVPAEGWVRSLELGRHVSLWTREGAALFDVATLVRVLMRGVPHVGLLPGDAAGRRYVVVRHGEGLALWLLPRDEGQAADAHQAERERAARQEVEAALARAEQTVSALREAEERYRLATRATHDVLWDWHFATDHVRWDPGTGNAFGHATSVLEHKLGWWGERVHDDDRDRVVDRLVEFVASTGDVWSEEYRFQRADGSWAHVLDRGVLARDDEGRPVRMIGSMMDVTERTRQMETMVEEARFRERFIGILGHDLRNPLNAIVLSARAQKRRGPLECTPEQHRQHAQRIEASATRMGNMIADLLDLTRAGRRHPAAQGPHGPGGGVSAGGGRIVRGVPGPRGGRGRGRQGGRGVGRGAAGAGALQPGGQRAGARQPGRAGVPALLGEGRAPGAGGAEPRQSHPGGVARAAV